MQFESLGAVKQFAGEDYEKSYVPEKAKKVLSKHDDRSQHYESEGSNRLKAVASNLRRLKVGFGHSTVKSSSRARSI